MKIDDMRKQDVGTDEGEGKYDGSNERWSGGRSVT